MHDDAGQLPSVEHQHPVDELPGTEMTSSGKAFSVGREPFVRPKTELIKAARTAVQFVGKGRGGAYGVQAGRPVAELPLA